MPRRCPDKNSLRAGIFDSLGAEPLYGKGNNAKGISRNMPRGLSRTSGASERGLDVTVHSGPEGDPGAGPGQPMPVCPVTPRRQGNPTATRAVSQRRHFDPSADGTPGVARPCVLFARGSHVIPASSTVAPSMCRASLAQHITRISLLRLSLVSFVRPDDAVVVPARPARQRPAFCPHRPGPVPGVPAQRASREACRKAHTAIKAHTCHLLAPAGVCVA